MATRSPNAARKIAAAAGVSAISGTISRTPRPASRTARDEPQVDLGLAAAGDAVKKRRMVGLRRRALQQRRQRRLLLAGEIADGVREMRSVAVRNGSRSRRRRSITASPSFASRVTDSAGNVLIREVAERNAVGRAAQEVQRLLLLRAELQACPQSLGARLFRTLRGEHRHPDRPRRVGRPLQRARQRDQAVRLEAGDDRLHAFRFLRQRADGDRRVHRSASSSTSRRAPRSTSIRASPASVMAACRSLSIHARGGIAVAIASPTPQA